MDFLERWPKTSVAVTAAALILAVVSLANYFIRGNQRPKGDLWFYDIKARRLFPASDLGVPPIDSPSGPGTGVRAQVFSCGECTEKERFIAYLETLTPQGKELVEAQVKANGNRTGIGFALEKQPYAVLVRLVDDETWYPQASAEGQALMQAGRLRGGCQHPRPCVP